MGRNLRTGWAHQGGRQLAATPILSPNHAKKSDKKFKPLRMLYE